MSNEFRRAIRPPTSLSVSEWCMKNVKVMGSERAPFFDVNQFPWWRFPLDAMGNPEIKKVIVVAPTGAGKSTAIEALHSYIVAEDPGRSLYACQSNDKAKIFVETRLNPSLKACKALDGLWAEDRHASRKHDIIFPHMAMSFGGANMSNFQEVSCRYLFGDETWTWTEGLIKEFFARHHDRWNRKGYLISQGGKKQSEFFKECQKGDEYHLHFACPQCDILQPFTDAGIVVDLTKNEHGEIDYLATKQTARVKCANCEHEISDTSRNRRSLSNASQYILTRKGTEEGTIYCTFNRMAIWWVEWGDMWERRTRALEALKRGVYDPYRQYKQKDMAEFWDDEYIQEKVDIIGGGYEKSEMTSEKLPNEISRFITCDRGQDHYWHIAQAGTSDGKLHVLSEGYLHDERNIRDVQATLGVPNNCVYVDSSWNFDESLDICERNGWIGIRGDQRDFFPHKDRDGNPIQKTYSKYNFKKCRNGKIAKYFFVSTRIYKDMMQRLRQHLQIVTPDDVSTAYKSHMESEIKVDSVNAKTGEVTHYWKQIKKQNHLLDCQYYGVAVGDLKGVFAHHVETELLD